MQTMLRRWSRYIALVLGFGLLAPPVHADGLGVIIQRVDAAQFPNVRVYVSVATANGIPITGLDTRAFELQEDGKPVDGLAVEPVVESQEAVLTALAVDVSGSMNDEHKLERAKDAASGFVDALGPNDRVSLISFASSVNVVQDYTADKAALKKAIDGLTADGNTQLYDALVQAARRQATQPERRRPVIVMTDGDDTSSSATVDSAIAAATNANSVVYAIGLGSEVNKDALGQLASGTGGQAVYVSDPADLKSTLLSISDHLRRQYVLKYTSKARADTQPHGLAIQATFAGQQSTGLKSFTIPLPPTITVGGLNTTSPIANNQHVTVDVSGGAQQIQLLVGDRLIGSAQSSPATFDWDPSSETSGPRHVVVRYIDMQGVSRDKPFDVTVSAPVPMPTPTAVVVPTSPPVVVAPPTTNPVTNTPSIDTGVLVGSLLLLMLLALTVWYLSRGSGPRIPAFGGMPTPTRAPWGDITDLVVGGARNGGTIIRGGFNRAKPAPQVRLKVVRGVKQTEISTRDSPITLGREKAKASVVIDDPLVSGAHALIRRDGVQFSVEDLRSKNGTRLNGEPLAPGPESRRPLKTNDQIYMGDTVVTFVVDSR